MYDLIFYTTSQEESPVDEFLDFLGEKPRAKVERFLGHLKAVGPNLPRPYADTLRGKIRELRAHYGDDQYRILYFGAPGRVFVLLHAFEKRSEKIPEREVRTAAARMQTYLKEDRR